MKLNSVNHLINARERRVNRPEGLMTVLPVDKKIPDPIEPTSLETMVRNYNEYAKIPKLITV